MKKINKGIAAVVVLAATGIGIALMFAPADASQPAAKPASAAPSASTPAGGDTVVDDGWTERCGDKAKKNCEVFSRLEMKASNMRVAEVAVGFPQDNSLPKGTARGVIILPLGIMLESGATMSVDDGKPFAFKSRYCTDAGCFSFVNMNKDIIKSLKNGKELNLFFKTADNHDAHLIMGLKGFDKQIDKID